MDSNRPEAKPGKIMKRAKKRPTADSEKKAAKFDESRDKSNSGIIPENDINGQDLGERSLPEGADGSSGDTSSSEELSFNLALSMVLNQKKKELLQCPEIMQFLQHVSRNP